MDFCVALTSTIATDCTCNGFKFQRSLSQHLHWHFPNLGRRTTGCSLRLLFVDPSISSPAKNARPAAHTSVSSLALPNDTAQQLP